MQVLGEKLVHVQFSISVKRLHIYCIVLEQYQLEDGVHWNGGISVKQ